MIRHKEIGFSKAEAGRLLGALNGVLGPVREPNSVVALQQSREFNQQVAALQSRVFYACRPGLNTIAICFRQSNSNFETHLEISAPPGAAGVKATCDLCESAGRSLADSFNSLKLKPRLTATVEEDSGAQTNIRGRQETVWTRFREHLSKENVLSGILTGAVVLFLSIHFKAFAEVWADALTGLIAVPVLAVFLLVSSIIERTLAKSRTSSILKWEYE